MNKHFDPTFWEHPTFLNLAIIVIGLCLFAWILLWAAWVAANIFPWPTFG